MQNNVCQYKLHLFQRDFVFIVTLQETLSKQSLGESSETRSLLAYFQMLHKSRQFHVLSVYLFLDSINYLTVMAIKHKSKAMTTYAKFLYFWWKQAKEHSKAREDIIQIFIIYPKYFVVSAYRWSVTQWFGYFSTKGFHNTRYLPYLFTISTYCPRRTCIYRLL